MNNLEVLDAFGEVKMPLLALRGLVIFPKMVASFDVAREKSINALKSAMDSDQLLFVVTQKDFFVEEPQPDDLYVSGCVVKIKQILRVSDTLVKVLVEGICRADRTEVYIGRRFNTAGVIKIVDNPMKTDMLYEAYMRKVKFEFSHLISLLPNFSIDVIKTAEQSEDLAYLCDFIAFNIPSPFEEKQQILEETSSIKRAALLYKLLVHEADIAEIDREIGEKTKDAIDESQKEFYLREQLRIINNELYGDDTADEIEDYYAKIDSLCASDAVKEEIASHVSKLSKMPSGSHEGTVERNFLDACIALPWDFCSKSTADVKKAKKILDRDIYGMDKVKDRILELISVYSLSPDIKGQIICLAGPPGVGKTSIGKTVAECMSRRFARVSLGGVHDEAEIRGHRKTYVGSMPGRILDAVKKAGTSNPLILLDEIDKLGNDYKGDPASALLEVLDGEQNVTFVDHFIEIPYDLSKAVFIATANNIDNIPEALRDRMEIIELKSYTREEKFSIAKIHLVPKQIAANGLKKMQLRISDEAIYSLIDFYTREAGVRKLERSIASLCRKTAKIIASGEAKKVTITPDTVVEMLGNHKYRPEVILPQDEVGIINGLAWTSVGGEIMQLEVSSMPGTGNVELTGSLGDVMKESAMAAISYVRANADKYDINSDFYKENDIHIHATEAAVPKDGPSAGVTMTVGLVSALTGCPVKRDIALTGEVTIRGRVLPIGGLAEKSMAAYRGGVKQVFIPKDNLPDLDDVDNVVKQNVEFIPVSFVSEIIDRAIDFSGKSTAAEWSFRHIDTNGEVMTANC